VSTPPPTSVGDYQYSPAPASTVPIVAGRTRTQFFGTVLSVTSVSVPVRSGSGPLRVGLLDPDGSHTTWIGSVPAGPGTRRVNASAPTASSGIVFEAGPDTTPGLTPERVVIGAAVVRTAGQGTYRVDGSLRDAVMSPRWRYRGMIGPFSIFTQSSAAGQVWVQGDPHSAVRVVSSTPWGDETVRVTTSRPATLVRSEQFASGWQATVITTDDAARTQHHAGAVRRHGLIQAVAVPEGTSLVHFTYRPHRVLEGFIASGLGFIVLVGLVAWPVVRRRRRDSGARHTAAR